MRYRKKPVIIDAMQWNGSAMGAVPVIQWVLDNGGTARYHDEEPFIAIDTLEGVIYGTPGDWFIRGIRGEFYPCKPDIFDETYEAAA